MNSKVIGLICGQLHETLGADVAVISSPGSRAARTVLIRGRNGSSSLRTCRRLARSAVRDGPKHTRAGSAWPLGDGEHALVIVPAPSEHELPVISFAGACLSELLGGR